MMGVWTPQEVASGVGAFLGATTFWSILTFRAKRERDQARLAAEFCIEDAKRYVDKLHDRDREIAELRAKLDALR